MADEAKTPLGGRSLTVVWMVLALLVVGGFLTWLGVASEPSTVAVVEENGDQNGALDGLMVVERDTMAANVSRFAGELVRVQGVDVTGLLGPGIFWGELGEPGRQIPILVRMDSALVGTVQVEMGTPYTLTGVVTQVSEERVNQWAERGEFRGEGEQMQATFADYYIQASMVRPTRGARAEPTGPARNDD